MSKWLLYLICKNNVKIAKCPQNMLAIASGPTYYAKKIATIPLDCSNFYKISFILKI